MRKVLTAAFLLALLYSLALGGVAYAASSSVAINATNFPDATFRSYISEEYDVDMNGTLSSTELASITDLNVEESEITSLKGVEYFTALTVLDCSWNSLTTLDVSKNTKLEELYCELNDLTTLNVSKNTALHILSCGENRLTALDVTKCTALQELWCESNQLTTLNLAKCTALETLVCEENNLKTLDLSGNTALSLLACGYNPLSALNLSKCAYLLELYCEDAGLTALDISKCPELFRLHCYGNAIAKLDVTGNANLLMCVNEGDSLFDEIEFDSDGGAAYTSNVYWYDLEDDVYELRVSPQTLVITGSLSTPDFTLPSSVTTIEAEAFSGASMRVVALPSGLKSIGAKAFASCASLNQIYIPASVTSIAADAFSGCKELTIFAPAGSAAETFATKYGFSFVSYVR